MAKRELILIGASAGGIEALRALVPAFPDALSATVLVVVHMMPAQRSRLAELLNARSGLLVLPAQDGAPLVRGRIYVGPPGLHLTVTTDRIRLDGGPRENGFRPAIDRLFRSAATFHGSRAIGVVLSGMRDDGTQGLAAIKRCGGLAFVQDPEEAIFPSMPRSAIANVLVDGVLPSAALAAELARRVEEDVEASAVVTSGNDVEERDRETILRTVVCPDCGGVMREIEDESLLRWVCRVGHQHAPESLLAAQGERLEEVLWAALNALWERRDLARRLAERAREGGYTRVAERHATQAEIADRRAEVIRNLLGGAETIADPTD